LTVSTSNNGQPVSDTAIVEPTDTLPVAAGDVDNSLAQIGEILDDIAQRQRHLESLINGQITSPQKLIESSSHFRRNVLPNDSAVTQKTLMILWQATAAQRITSTALSESGFRVFSQCDEDGILLRIFAHIGTTNRMVVEIGNNCDGSDIGIPQNLSTNLIVNHGWHGVLFEIDPTECSRLTTFFARNPATAHFHCKINGKASYFSPQIRCLEITPENVEDALADATCEREPDLFILDIDGQDFRVAQSLVQTRPRVVVVEFEKLLRDKGSFVQPDNSDINKYFAQSGVVSLLAWVNLLGRRGYILCAIGGSGFNAFFVRKDVAEARFTPLTPKEAFDRHPIFSQAPDGFWKDIDETWEQFEI